MRRSPTTGWARWCCAAPGRAFCSGDDLKDIENQTAGEAETRAFIEAIQEVSRRLVLGDKVVVGGIHGWAVGGGLEWAINCDLAVFGEGTRCFFPEIKWGMFPTGGATAILPRIVGLAKARELMLLGETFGATEAHEMGLAWRVVPDGAVFETAPRDGGAPSPPCRRGAVRELKRGAQPGGRGSISRERSRWRPRRRCGASSTPRRPSGVKSFGD